MSASAIYLWRGRSMIFARLADLDWHQHHAAGICVALEDTLADTLKGKIEDPSKPDAKLQLQSEAGGEWRDFRAIRIPPRCGHAFRFHGQAAAFLFFDPGSVFYESVFGDLTEPKDWPEAQAGDALHAIRRLWQNHVAGQHIAGEDVNNEGVADELAQIPCATADDDIATLYGDPRIQRVVRTILEWPEPDGAPDIESLARVAGLSASRLAHLFQERVGLPVRALRTWFRLKTAAIHIRRGASLTDAGVAAGFYDQAHFTRTFRQMFGLPPSQIFPRARSAVQWYIEAEELTLALGRDVQPIQNVCKPRDST